MINENQFDISIITPTLNAVQHIEKSIASVSAQNVRVQHIIVDGGSTDGTIEIAKEKGAVVIRLPGSSIYEALNKGIQYAQAPLVGFINADDSYASDDALLKAVDSFHAAGSKGVIYGNCIFEDSNGKTLYRLISPRRLLRTFSSLRVFSISHPAWYMEMQCMKDLGCYDTSLRFVADCDLIIRALEKNVKFTKIDFDFARFTLHGGNASQSEAAHKEQIAYFQRLNGRSFFKRIIRLILLTHLYSRDPRYFIYRLSRFIKKRLNKIFGENP